MADNLPDDGSRIDAIPAPPEIATEAKEQLEVLRKAVEDTAAVGSGLWLSYLFVLFYLAIAAGSVTHADLLLRNPVKLPFLNVELPLLAFFFLAPLLFLIVHAYTLVHLVLLAGRVALFNDALGKAAPADHDAWRLRLPSNIFVQFLGASAEIRERPFSLLLAAILWVTLVLAPIALFLLLQIQFLPYHGPWITWMSRVGVILDLGLLWWLWRSILGSRVGRRQAHFLWPAGKTAIGVLLSASTILFACVLATIPGEWQEDHLPAESALGFLRDHLFAGAVDDATRRRSSLFSNTLVLPGFNIYEALKIDDPKKVEWKQHLIDLRGRDLRGAVVYGAVLTKADLTRAQLQSASLDTARLQGAELRGAQFQGAGFVGAELQGADLESAQLQGADLYAVRLQGASLFGAQLQGADMSFARLQGAELELARLQGANLRGAELQGASLQIAELQGANLRGAQLQGAELTAQLQGASLDHAFLWRARLQPSPSQWKDVFAGVLNWGPEQVENPEVPVPQAWTDATYTQLRQSIEQVVPKGPRRDAALKKIMILDCSQKDDTLASCDPSAESPNVVKQWKSIINKAVVEQAAYAKPLAVILGDLACSKEPNRIWVLRGLLQSGRFQETGSEMSALASRITSAGCTASTALTNADKQKIAALTLSH